jgi:hypothetical protein
MIQLLPSMFQLESTPVGSGNERFGYVDATDDRWFGVARGGGLDSSRVFRFTMLPLMDGEFILPPFLAYDPADPRRAGWSGNGHAVVQ